MLKYVDLYLFAPASLSFVRFRVNILHLISCLLFYPQIPIISADHLSSHKYLTQM